MEEDYEYATEFGKQSQPNPRSNSSFKAFQTGQIQSLKNAMLRARRSGRTVCSKRPPRSIIDHVRPIEGGRTVQSRWEPVSKGAELGSYSPTYLQSSLDRVELYQR